MRKIRIRLWFPLWWILLFLISPLEGIAQSDIRMNFKTRAWVQKEIIYLQDIASIKGSSVSLVEKIGRMKIHASPPPGEILVLSREDIARKMEGNSLASLVSRMQIPHEIEVLRQGRIIERREIGGILEEHLQRTVGGEGKTVCVKEVQGIDKIMVPPGALSWEVKVPPRLSSGNLPVSVALFVDGQRVQEARFHMRVEIYADVVMARNYLPRHQRIEEKDVLLVNRNILQFPPDLATNLKEVLGKRTTLSVNSQEILRKSMLEVPPLVKKGDRVTLVVENDDFRITSVGEVKEEGREGDRIKVINVSSKKEVYGRVQDAHTVRVDF